MIKPTYDHIYIYLCGVSVFYYKDGEYLLICTRLIVGQAGAS